MPQILLTSLADALGGPVPVGAKLTATATRARSAGDTVVANRPVKVDLSGGVPETPLLLDATGPGWCWHLRLTFADSGIVVVRWVSVPSDGPVEWADLVDVDPATLLPSESAVAAWTAAVGQVAAILADTAVARDGAVTAQGLSEAARDAAVLARGISEIARDGAVVAQGASEAARGTAVAASTTATTKATEAFNSAAAAEAAKLAAQAVPTTNDTVMAAVAADPASAFSMQQSATIATAVDGMRNQSTVLPVSNRVGFAGDSITNASGATSNNGFVHLVRYIAGTRLVDQVIHVYATGGYTSAQVLATHIPVACAGDAGVIHLAVGTNDGGGSVTVAEFGANVQAAYDQIVAAGKKMSVSLIPPRGVGATDAWRRDRAAFNEWLSQWAQLRGVPVADTSTLVDPTTGHLNAIYDSGDGTHPNDAGHAKIAEAVAAAVVRVLPVPAHRQVKSPSVNLAAGGAMDGAVTGGLPAGWAEIAGGTGTAPVYTTIADTTGTLHEGKWLQMAFDATAAGGKRTVRHGIGTLNADFAVGDQLEFAVTLQVEDVTGLLPAIRAKTAKIRVIMLSTSNTEHGVPSLPAMSSPIIGSVAYRVAAPNTTYPSFAVEVTLPTGVSAKVRIGQVLVRNLTKLGITKAI